MIFLEIVQTIAILMCVIGLYQIERHLDSLNQNGLKMTQESLEEIPGQSYPDTYTSVRCTYCGGSEHTSESPAGQLCLERQLVEAHARRG